MLEMNLEEAILIAAKLQPKHYQCCTCDCGKVEDSKIATVGTKTATVGTESSSSTIHAGNPTCGNPRPCNSRQQKPYVSGTQHGPQQSHESGPEEPHESGTEEPHGSGPEEPHESGPEEPHESGPEEPHGSGPEEPHGSGPEEPHESGPEEPHESGPEEPYESGPEKPLNEAYTESMYRCSSPSPELLRFLDNRLELNSFQDEDEFCLYD